MSLERRLKNLCARFDRVALQAPAVAPHSAEDALNARYSQIRQRLLDWCHTPARTGAKTEWQAAATQDFSIATLRGPDPATTTAWANAFARTLDGSTRLEAMSGRAAGLVWRLQIKLHDALGQRRHDDPWDVGWASTAPPAQRRLEGHFMPRRATLILAAADESAGLMLALAQLAQRSDDLDHPLRWLWVGKPVAPRSEHLRPSLTVALD
jgi:hypothetical protein